MEESVLIKNADISSNVPSYLQTFNEDGAVSFELLETQYEALQLAMRDYRLERKSLNFDTETWVKKASENGFFNNETVFHVICFLTLVWNANTKFSAEKRESSIVLHVIKVVGKR